MKKEVILQEIIAICLLAIAILVFLSLVSYDPFDLPWFTSTPNTPVHNLIKNFGAYLAGGLRFALGWGSYFIPIIFVVLSLQWFSKRFIPITFIKIIGLTLAFLSSSSFFSIFLSADNTVRFYRGGIVGLVFSDFLINYLSRVGAYVVIGLLGLMALPMITEISIRQLWLDLLYLLKIFLSSLTRVRLPKVSLPKVKLDKNRELKTTFCLKKKSGLEKDRALDKVLEEESLASSSLKNKNDKKEEKKTFPILGKQIDKLNIKISDNLLKQEKQQEPVIVKKQTKEISDDDYILPSLDLLDTPPPLSMRQIKEDLEANARVLEETLSDFGINVRVSNIERGPVITRYEVEPAPGVKVQRIVALSDDIALAMKASSIRIVAPIPGKAAVGVEVPNSHSSLVYLKDRIF